MLWHATAENAPDGGIGRFPDSDLEAELGWTGQAGALVDSLCETGWLDRVADPERLYVHDWHEHADYATHRKLARARLWFVHGEAPKCSTLQEKDRQVATEFYASNPRSTHDLLTKSLQGQERGDVQEREHKTARASRSPVSPPLARERTQILVATIRASIPRQSVPELGSPRWEKWCVEIDRLNRLDGWSWEEIDKLLAWLPGDDFWPGVIRSAKNLRKHFAMMHAKMKKPAPTKGDGGYRTTPDTTPPGEAERDQLFLAARAELKSEEDRDYSNAEIEARMKTTT